MPVRDDPLTFVIPRRFDFRWSPLGRALCRLNGDRLRAGAWQITLLTGAALGWLMAAYASQGAASFLGATPLAFWAALVGVGFVVALVGVVGVRPRTVVTAGRDAVHIERGSRQLRLSYASLARVEVVEAQQYHRHYRRYAAVRSFRGRADARVLLLHVRGGTCVAALGLPSEERGALRRHVERQMGPTDGQKAAPHENPLIEPTVR